MLESGLATSPLSELLKIDSMLASEILQIDHGFWKNDVLQDQSRDGLLLTSLSVPLQYIREQFKLLENHRKNFAAKAQ